MKYLLVLNINPDVLAALTEEEQQAIGAGHQKFLETTKASGEFHSTVALAEPAKSVVVKVRDGMPAVTDGPFVESKEHLGGFYIIDAADLDAALGWAAKVTAVIGAPIEVWPFWDAHGGA